MSCFFFLETKFFFDILKFARAFYGINEISLSDISSKYSYAMIRIDLKARKVQGPFQEILYFSFFLLLKDFKITTVTVQKTLKFQKKFCLLLFITVFEKKFIKFTFTTTIICIA